MPPDLTQPTWALHGLSPLTPLDEELIGSWDCYLAMGCTYYLLVSFITHVLTVIFTFSPIVPCTFVTPCVLFFSLSSMLCFLLMLNCLSLDEVHWILQEQASSIVWFKGKHNCLIFASGSLWMLSLQGVLIPVSSEAKFSFWYYLCLRVIEFFFFSVIGIKLYLISEVWRQHIWTFGSVVCVSLECCILSYLWVSLEDFWLAMGLNNWLNEYSINKE